MARYPKEFSKEACDRVEITRLRAIQKLEQVLAVEWPKYGHWSESRSLLARDRRALLECIQTVTLAFAAEARDLKRQDIWSVEDVNREVEKFERAFAEELGKYERHGRVLPSLTRYSMSDRCNILLPQVELELHTTPEWKAHIDDLIAPSEPSAAEEWLSVTEAAQRCELSKRQVERLIAQPYAVVESRKDGRRRLVRLSSLRTYRGLRG
jgi:hypothetical protein